MAGANRPCQFIEVQDDQVGFAACYLARRILDLLLHQADDLAHRVDNQADHPAVLMTASSSPDSLLVHHSFFPWLLVLEFTQLLG